MKKISKKKLGYFFSILKIGYISKSIFVYVKFNKFFLNLIKLLFLEGYISSYVIIKNYKIIKIYLKYKDNNPIFNFVNLNYDFYKSCSTFCFQNKKYFKGINYGLIVYSTNRGLKTLNNCLFEKISGNFLFQLN